VIQYTTFLSTWYQSTGSESPYIYFLLFSAYIFSARLVFSGKYFALSFSVLFLLVVSADQYTAGNLGRRPFQSCRTQPNRSFHAPSRAARSSVRHAPPRASKRPHAPPHAPGVLRVRFTRCANTPRRVHHTRGLLPATSALAEAAPRQP
jgi:hypothetical protein